MKYLKTYESLVDSPDYYNIISSEEFSENTRIELFDEQDIYDIQKVCVQKNINFDILNDGYKISLELNYAYLIFPIRSIIYKQDDEWFILAHNINSIPTYYRADQLEGLIKLIQDLV